MKHYEQAVARYFALLAEILELEIIEYEIVKKLFQKLLKTVESSVEAPGSSPHELLRAIDSLRLIQKQTVRQQSAAIEGMLQPIIKKLMESSKDDPELKKLDAKIRPLLERMDKQRETFRSAKETFSKILQNLKRSDEAN